jgi:DNA-binding NarL/FixJ family response regulator
MTDAGAIAAPSGGDLLAEARAASARGDWPEALAAAQAATVRDRRQEGERLDLLADALWWTGRIEECIVRREAAYRAFEEAGDDRRAGQCAVWLYEHHCFRARPAHAGGWLARARRSLGPDPDCAEHGALVLREAEVAHGRGDLARAAALAGDMVALGRRLPSADLEAEALQALGRVLIDQGDVVAGMARLDEAMLSAVEGRLGFYSTAKVYCSVIAACEDLGDVRRAAEWTEATARWADEHSPFAVFPGICRVHRASTLRWRGALADAEREAVRACAELHDVHTPNAAAAYAEVGDIRRRLGDLEGAEEAFARAEELCGSACVGLALLRLAQGRVGAATAVVERCLDAAGPHVSARARLLPARAQVAVAAGDLDTARAATAELEATAAEVGGGIVAAAALGARGRLQLAEGDHRAACATLRAALAAWQDLEVPYEAATTRTLLGLALRDAGDREGAAASFAAAEALFEQIGARVDARHTRELTGPSRLPAGLTEREAEVLRLVATGATNREVAAELALSEKTVSRHLSNIFTKLGVTSRSAATAFAFEHDLTRR